MSETKAKSTLKDGEKPLLWKPKQGLVELGKEREKLFNELKEMPGKTPLEKIEIGGSELFVKMECENKPTGSHYDRVYLYLLECLERTGINPKDFALVETSSGNATPAFGYFARRLGYETMAFLPAELSDARKKLSMEQCDKIVVADPKRHGWGVFGAANAMREALEQNRAKGKGDEKVKRLYCVNHSQVAESLEAIKTMAIEIKEQLKGGKIDYFLGIAGNGTILFGAGSELKKVFPKIKIIGVETQERPVLFEMKFPGKYERIYGKKPATVHDMKGKEFFAPGTGALGVDFPHLKSAAELVQDVLLVGRQEANEALKELHSKGEMVGHTSAISYAAAKKIANENPGKSILIIFYDKIDRY